MSITKLEMAQLFTAYLEYLTGDKVEDIIRKSRISNAKKGMMNDTSDRAAERREREHPICRLRNLSPTKV